MTNEGHGVEVEQGYCIVPSEKKFVLLCSFLMVNRSKKGIVFFSSCSVVSFYSNLLRYDSNVDCFDLHGKQMQQKKTSAFFDFCMAGKGFLLSTGEAARGLDFPAMVYLLSLLQFTYQNMEFLLLITNKLPTLISSICYKRMLVLILFLLLSYFFYL